MPVQSPASMRIAEAIGRPNGAPGGAGGDAPSPGWGDSQIDAQIDVVTPENIAFHYEVAGPFRRLPAYLVDLVIRIALCVAILFALGTAGVSVGLADAGIGLALIGWLIIGHFYGGLFETFWNGQTPGKRALNLRVLSIDGGPVNALQAVLRNLLRDVDAMPMVFFTLTQVGYVAFAFINWLGLYWVAIIAMALNSRFQRLGDLACGTMVVVERRASLYGVVRINHPAAISLAAQLPADFVVSRSLGRALSAYVERRQYLAPYRRAEIARHVGAPLAARFDVPRDTSHDLLLCALYHRTFFTDRQKEPPMPPSEFAPVFSSYQP